ncbi:MULTISPECIES: hypothetical protein [Microbacterium]|uniref:hypothetical protein n=1 Tax=Microbacterium TaxID=33882 RepID=UPI0011B08A82|nr:hypothetical protein [Microbacterium sp. MYb72]
MTAPHTDRPQVRRSTPPALRSTALGFVSLGLGVLALLLGAACVVLDFTVSGIGTAYGSAFAIGAVAGVAALATGIIAMSTHRGQLPGTAGVVLAVLAALLPLTPVVLGWSWLVGLSFLIGV